jgi:hypothetical protein
MIRLRDVLEGGVLTEIRPGIWVEDRPLHGSFMERLRDAWAVLRGRADALTWPDDRPQTWCAVDRGNTGPRFSLPRAGAGA